MIARLFQVLCVVTISSGLDTCGSEPIGPCTAGLCPSSYTCINNFVCCSTTDINVTSSLSTCDNAIGPCISNLCASGYTCTNDFCCPNQPIIITSSANTCVDKTNPKTGKSDCASNANLCNDSRYYALMTEQCPKTCGRCSSTGITTTTPPCVDKVNSKTGKSDCASSAYLCNDPSYYKLMTQQCPKTCGRC